MGGGAGVWGVGGRNLDDMFGLTITFVIVKENWRENKSIEES